MFKDEMIALVKHDPVLVELDRQMDEKNRAYEKTYQWIERRFHQIASKNQTESDRLALKWLDKKNVQILKVHTDSMLEITDRLANHMSEKGLLPKSFDKSRHYIGITTSGGVYITCRAASGRTAHKGG
jgi:hypothetical protein